LNQIHNTFTFIFLFKLHQIPVILFGIMYHPYDLDY